MCNEYNDVFTKQFSRSKRIISPVLDLESQPADIAADNTLHHRFAGNEFLSPIKSVTYRPEPLAIVGMSGRWYVFHRWNVLYD